MQANTPAPTRKLKILVVEDNIINQRIARELLGQLGHTGVVVGDGQQALRALAALQFDMVLMDVMMPVMDGIQALAAIRQKELTSGRHQPIIMVTAHTESGDAARFMQAGADGYLAKPLQLTELQQALATLAASA